MFFTPLQMIAGAGMLYQRNKIAIEQVKIAADQLETLKKIEQQIKETKDRIGEQGPQTETTIKDGGLIRSQRLYIV